MEQLSLLQKIYQYGETLSSEELNQIVEYLNSSIEAINTLIARNNNINEGHCEMRYKVSAQQPEAPESGTDGKSNGWSDTYTRPDTANGEITWMTLSFFNGEGVYGSWSTPVCITWGSIRGQVGPKGDTGLKGSFKSRVFKRQNSRPDTPTGGTYESPIPSEGGWTDGVPSGSAIIWSSVCTFYGNGLSSGWSVPAPESDNDTLDIEFSPSAVQPGPPTGNIPFSNHESEGWYDSSSNQFNNVGTMIWRAERKVSNGEYNGDWTITRIVGEKGEKGDPGNTGGHYEFRYRNYTPSEQYPTPSKPATGSNGTTDGWSETQQTLSETDIKNGYATWMTQCYVDDEGEYGEWTSPIRITGANGYDGVDGNEIEFVYALKTSVWNNPTPPPTTQADDWHGTTSDGTVWTDNPQGVTEIVMYEYISQRSKINNVWSAYSTPVLWSKWGEKGQDGDGVQYIYKLFSTELTSQQCIDNIPDKPSSKNEHGEWVPSGTGKNAGWYDDPISPTVSQPYCYCSVIKELNGTWGSFEKLSLWARFSKDGNDSTVPGPDGKGITYILTRDIYTESEWNSTASVGSDNDFTRNLNGVADLGTSCRVGDFFIVKGTATDPPYKFHQATFRCTNFTDNTIYGTCISHVKDGDAGVSITGKTGPMFYIAGIWKSTTQYTKNDYKCPVVMLASNNKYYYLKETSSQGQNPSSYTNIWGEADNFAAVFTQVLFSEFAKLGSFVLNQDWMISQHGVEYDSSGNLTMVIGDNTTNYQNFKTSNPTTNLSGEVNFCPNLAIDAKTGRVYAQRMDVGGSSTFKGTVFAESGLFNGVVNASQFKAGNDSGFSISTSADSLDFNYNGTRLAFFSLRGWDSANNQLADVSSTPTGFYLYMTNPLDGHLITIDFNSLSFTDLTPNTVTRHEQTFYSISNSGTNTPNIQSRILYYSVENNVTKWWNHSDSSTELTSQEMGTLYKKYNYITRGEESYGSCVQKIGTNSYKTTPIQLYEEYTLQNNVPTKTGNYVLTTHLANDGTNTPNYYFVMPDSSTTLTSQNTSYSIYTTSSGPVQNTTAVYVSQGSYSGVPTFSGSNPISLFSRIDDNGNPVSILYPGPSLNL